MESKIESEKIIIKTRKESNCSNASTSTSSSNDDEEKKQDKKEEEKIEIEIDLTKNEKIKDDKYEKFLSEIDEVEISRKTFCQKLKNICREEDIENPLYDDENRSIEEIIESKGFKSEKHTIKTEDGYTLILFRIPGGKNIEDGSKLPPVLLQHGLFDSSDGWVCNGEFHSISFVLASHNFDVWISNSRGNKYCKKHDKYKEDSFEFWQFSFHDLGKYDLPAIIKYIRKTNKSNEKIIYFGHSQGTTMMFSGLTEQLDFYKNNIKLFVALAPVTRLNNLGSSFLNLLTNISIHKIMKKAKTYEICPHSEGTSNFLNFMEKNANGLTNFFIGLLSDSNSRECNDQNSLSVYFKHYPCGTSLKNLIHYIQIIKSKKFIHFDYKEDANFIFYNQKEPPEYNLSLIKDIPIMLITGEKDKLATVDDARWLYNEIKTNVIYFDIVPNMGHLSFMCGRNFSWFKEPLEIILEEFYPK